MSTLSLESIGSPNSLIEQTWKTLRETRRAVSSHDLTRVGNVRLLILGGTILSIPARREHELETDTISAVGIKVGLVWEEVAVERTLGGLGIVEAVESESGLTEEWLLCIFAEPEGFLDIGDGVSEVALVGVACDHLETSGEGGKGCVAGIGVEEVVSGRG